MPARCIVAAAACVIAVVSSGVGIAAAEGGTHQPRHPRVYQPATQPARRALAAAPTGTSTTFVPVSPCRIADTRHGGGAVKAGGTRTFRVSGTSGFPAQGGHSGGCGVPAAAKSVAVSVSAVGETRNGYVTVYPDGAARPLASSVLFTRGVAIAAATDATLGSGGGIRAYLGSTGSAHLVLDVTGYYIGPLWAEVSNAGAVLAGSRVVSAAAFPRARYSVHFDRDVSGCALSVTNYGSGVTAHAQPLSGDATGVDVGIEDSADETPIFDQFYLVVTC